MHFERSWIIIDLNLRQWRHGVQLSIGLVYLALLAIEWWAPGTLRQTGAPDLDWWQPATWLPTLWHGRR